MANTTGKKFGGRKKGQPNKLTTEVKELVLQAFNKVGGADYLVERAKDNPVAFMTLLGKVIPTQVNAELNHRITAMEVIRKG